MDDTGITARFDELIENITGISVDKIKYSASEDIHRHIDADRNTKIDVDKSALQSMYRGNMLLAMGHVMTDIDLTFNKTFGIND